MTNKQIPPDGYVRVNFFERMDKKVTLKKIAKLRRIPMSVMLREVTDEVIERNTHLLHIALDK